MGEIIAFLNEWWFVILLAAILVSPIVLFIGFNGIVKFLDKIDKIKADLQRKRDEKRALAKKNEKGEKAEDEYTPSKEIQFTNKYFETYYKGSDKVHNGIPSGVYVDSVGRQFDRGECVIVFVGSEKEHMVISNKRILLTITSPTRRVNIAGQVRLSSIKNFHIDSASFLLVVNNQAIGYLPMADQYDVEFITGFLTGLLQLVKEDMSSLTSPNVLLNEQQQLNT